MSSAALVQLMATGASDASIIDPVKGATLWSMSVKPHTPFSMESVELVFNGVADFNKTATVDLVRSCDLMYSMHLQVTLPSITINTASCGFSWARDFGHKMINNVFITVGSLQIDKHYGPWLAIWAQLTLDSNKHSGYGRMVGDSNMTNDALTRKMFGKCTGFSNADFAAADTTKTTGGAGYLPTTMLYVPLQFWFNRVPGLALPLVALQFHQVRLQFTFNDIGTLNGVFTNSTTPAAVVSAGTNAATSISNIVAASKCGAFSSSALSGLTSIRLFGTNINLGAPERTAFATNQQKYLIEQLQYSSGDNISSASQTVRLQLSHPVKFLAWTARPTVTSADADSHDFQIYSSTETAALTPTLMGSGAASTGAVLSNALYTGAPNALTSAALVGAPCGVSPLSLVGLKFNSSDRFLSRDGSYFNLVQPYDHFPVIPRDAGIHVYSFALDPIRSQPTGSANFSRLDTVSMVLAPRCTASLGTNPLQFSYYALNLNTFVVSGGMGGIAWAN